MTIWTYRSIPASDAHAGSLRRLLRRVDENIRKMKGMPRLDRQRFDCRFCRRRMTTFEVAKGRGFDLYPKCIDYDAVCVCRLCGWWMHIEKRFLEMTGNFDDDAWLHYRVKAYVAGLLEFDAIHERGVIEDIRRYLLAQNERLRDVGPATFERVVADAFKSIGYEAEATGRRGDGGIDVVLRRGKSRVAVQVKTRPSGNNIEVSELRELVGALVIRGFTRGIFVTTGDFSRGAYSESELLARRTHRVLLIDGQQFLERLRIGIRPAYNGFDDWQKAHPDKAWPYVQPMGTVPSSWA